MRVDMAVASVPSRRLETSPTCVDLAVTSTGLIAHVASSRIHLPAPLGSAGVTPFPCYYERSDCRGAACAGCAPVALPSSRRLAFRAFCPQTPMRSCSVYTTPQRSRPFVGLRLFHAGSPVASAETGSCSYGLLVHFQVLSTPSREDAVPFSCWPECGLPGEDSHLPDQSRSKAHVAAASSPPALAGRRPASANVHTLRQQIALARRHAATVVRGDRRSPVVPGPAACGGRRGDEDVASTERASEA